MLPCGTPEITGKVSERLLLIDTFWKRLVKYSLNHAHKPPVIPIDHNLSNMML